MGKRQEQRLLWHAIDHRSGKVLTYVFGGRKDEMLLKLKALLKPFGIGRYDTDYWVIYMATCYLEAGGHQPDKRHIQKIKRLTHKTICFSRSIQMHDLAIGLFINRYEFVFPI